MASPLQERLDAPTPVTGSQAPVVVQNWRLLEEIEAAIRSGDVNALGSASKALKGSITSALAQQAFEVASILENTLDEDHLERALDACRRLRDAINALHSADAQKPQG
jgi:hypothetical protein